MNVITRDYVADIAIRADGTGRTVHGIIVPYGQEATVSDGGPVYREMFSRGAFAADIAGRGGNFGRVKFLYQHDRNRPIGRAIELRDDAAGVYGAFRVSATTLGDETLEMLRDGTLDSFSIGFLPVTPAPGTRVPRDGLVVRTEAVLRETSAVTFAAYVGALVAGVRASDPIDFPDRASGEEAAEVPPPSDSDFAPLGNGMSPGARRGRLYPTLTTKESK